VNRRVAFFAIAALLCFALIPVIDVKFHWVPRAIGILYAVLALLATFDLISRRRL
jgi:uncharacterized membrane protein